MPIKVSVVQNLPSQSKIAKILREERRTALLDSARYVRALAARYPQQNL